MKIVLITSSITYTPNNYNDVLNFLLADKDIRISGIVLVDINNAKTTMKIPYLYYAGAYNIANTLLKNVVGTLFKTKENIFKRYAIPYIRAKSANSPNVTSWLKKLKPDLIINLRTRCIYRTTLLDIPSLGCINIHHGLLPKQRGLFCDLYALSNNQETGFSIHKMSEKIDDGEIYFVEKVKYNKHYMKYLKACAKKEKVALANFIKSFLQSRMLPQGTPNICDGPVLTSTPSFGQIKQFKQKGMKL